jgi:Protein of unknown function (DUF3987)/Primase C terminal 2 (PriCT-2)/Bifunctional DNA primase/polymerase, N-terminal
MSDAPRFADLAVKLVENGYQPLPLHFGRKNPCAGDGWQHYEFREADLKRFSTAGTGILCGKVIGLDIDVRDAVLAAQVEAIAEEMFGPAPRRVGQPPKVLRVLQAEAPFAKLATRGYKLPGDRPEDKAHRVEILATGQQFVAYNKHPDTGRPYAWNGGGEPLSTPIGLLPVISASRAREFIASAEQLLAQHGRAVGKLVEADEARFHEPSEEQRAADGALLRQALAALPNDDLEFDDWIRVAYAVKGALGEEGLADFLTWSAKSAKDAPEFSAREYTAARPAKIGAGTVYYLATRAGWQRPQATPQPDTWPDPVNLFAELGAAPFEAAELPDELAAYPRLYAQQTGIDASIAFTAAAGSAAAAIPDQIQVCADSSTAWFAQPRLWVLAIGAPGAGKSPAQRAMLEPLWKLHSELDAQWREEVRGLPEEEPKPPRPRVIVGDTTLEALSDVLTDNPRGVLVATDEFDAWLGALDQYKSGGIGRDRGEWLRLFDGGPHQVERVKRGSMFVPNWGASILTATTPAAMRRLTRHLPEDGLLQRFIVVLAGRQRITTQQPERAEIEAERARYTQTLRRLWSMAPRAHNGVVPLSIAALQRFATWRAENAELQEALGSLDSALEAHVAKYPTLALRLALTFHCVRIANFPDERSRDPAAWPIPLETLEKALAFLRRASRHALALYLGRRGGSPAFELARNVARYILARPPAERSVLQRRDVLRHVIAFRNAEEDDQGATLRLLTDLGWIRETEGGYTKAQPTRFAVNPGLASKFAALADKERERRAKVRERITEGAQQRRADHVADD